MNKFSLLTVIALASMPGSGVACSIIMPPPADEFRQSSLVALAVPLAISYRPKGAAKPGFNQSFRQTIQWQVLLGWKGGVRSGDKFTTRRMFSDDPEECSAHFPVRFKEAQLVFAQGREPFSDFHAFGPEYSQHYFAFLESQHSK
jgi:hypothetical protein